MTRQLKRLLALLVLLFILVGIVVFFIKTPVRQHLEETNVIQDTSTVLLDLPKEMFVKAEISNAFGKYTVQNKQGEIVLIDEFQQISEHLDPIAVANLVEQLCSVKASSSFALQGDLSDFGLQPARASIVVYDGSEPITWFIGNDAPSNAGVYVRIQGNPSIYLVEKKAISRLIQAPIDFLEKQITSPLPQNAQVDRITLRGENYKQTVVIEKSGQKNDVVGDMPYQIVSPKKLEASSYLSERMIPSFFGMSAVQVVSYNKNSAELEAFGLRNPHTIANIEYRIVEELPVLEYKGEKDVDAQASVQPEFIEKTLELKASKPDENGFIYVTSDQLPMIFYINNEVAVWAGVPYSELMGSLILYPDITSLKTLTVKTPEQTAVFEIVYDNQADQLKVTSQGKQVDSSAFTSFYQNLVGVYRTYQENRQQYAQTPTLSVTFDYLDEKKSPDTVAYFPIIGRTYQIVINGEEDYTTTQNFMGAILEDLQSLAVVG